MDDIFEFMKSNNKMKNFYWILLLLFLALVTVTGRLWISAERVNIVYVDNQRLFDGFQMKKELEQQLISTKGQGTGIADSLKIELMGMESSYSSIAKEKQELFQKEFMAKRNQWLSLTQQIEAADKELESTFTSQIWNQLNQYVQDYGEQENIDMIIGANGDGSLMYSKNDMDITDELITYINKRYDGKK